MKGREVAKRRRLFQKRRKTWLGASPSKVALVASAEDGTIDDASRRQTQEKLFCTESHQATLENVQDYMAYLGGAPIASVLAQLAQSVDEMCQVPAASEKCASTCSTMDPSEASRDALGLHGPMPLARSSSTRVVGALSALASEVDHLCRFGAFSPASSVVGSPSSQGGGCDVQVSGLRNHVASTAAAPGTSARRSTSRCREHHAQHPPEAQDLDDLLATYSVGPSLPLSRPRRDPGTRLKRRRALERAARSLA